MINRKKKGDASITTLIAIALGVAILVFSLVYLAGGFGSLGSFFSNNNVDKVKQACSNACLSNSVFDYCTAARSLKVADDKLDIKASCYIFANSNEFNKYGIDTCTINCDNAKISCSNIAVANLNGKSISSEEITKKFNGYCK